MLPFGINKTEEIRAQRRCKNFPRYNGNYIYANHNHSSNGSNARSTTNTPHNKKIGCNGGLFGNDRVIL